MPRTPKRGRIVAVCASVGLLLAVACGAQQTESIQWTNIGPGGGGWITCLTCDPENPDTLYAGCDVGGIYKSTDAGRNWTVTGRGLTADYVERILVDPTDTRTLYIAGTGGIFKSVDAGQTWRWLRNGFPEPAEYRYGAPVGALAMHPDDHLTLYAGIGYPRRGTLGNGLIYKTTDGGETWKALDGIAKLAPEACFYQIAIRPDRPEVMLAGTNKGLFRSEDAGGTWRKIVQGLPGDFIADLVISPTDPDVVYVTVWTTPGVEPWQGGVCRSPDGGETFASVAEGLPQHVGKPGAPSPMTSNFLKVAVDPTDADLVYAGASSWVGAGLFRSADGGASWERITHRGEDGNMEMGWISMGGLPSIKCIAISPAKPGRIFFGDPMRILLSDDGGASWEQRYTREVRPGWWQGTGLETTCISSITVDPTDSDRVYFGYADVGLLVTEDGGKSFARRVEGIPWHGDMAPVVVDPQRPNALWCGMGKVKRHTGGVARSEDYGKSWTAVGKPEAGLPDAATAHLVLDPVSDPDSRTLYVTSAGHGVYKSTDGGATWRLASSGLPVGKDFTARCLLLSPHDRREVFVAVPYSQEMPLGAIYKSSDGGGSWRKLNQEPELPDVFGLAIDPRDAAVIFAACRRHYDHDTGITYPGGIYRSADGGAHWEHVLDDRFASSVLISPASSEIVYAGFTDHPYHDNCKGSGVMKSVDGGRTWRAENRGLTDTQVGTIVCDPQQPAVLYVGTGGHGVFKGLDTEVSALRPGQ